MNSALDVLSSATPGEVEALLDTLSDNALMAMPYMFDLWALRGHQLPPMEKEWTTWVILGGRGAGKTRAGAEWVRAQVEGSGPLDPGVSSRVALIGETLDQAREIMVFGPSGILACSPPDRRPEWQATRRRLVWPNGAEATIYSASDPESLRGPQFDCAWCDELAKWKKGQDAWDMLQFALRLGEHPRQVITTTPRANGLLELILEDKATAITSAPTEANARNLSPDFLRRVKARYEGTVLGRQELDGELVLDLPGALWRREMLDRVVRSDLPKFDRVILAVDPPVTGKANSDACGIIVVGAQLSGPPQDWRAWVLADASVEASKPIEWARTVVEVAHRWQVDRVVAEVNQGGDLVETLIRQIDPLISYSAVRASRGKTARAEPVAALYDQGRVSHAARFPKLEDQMIGMARHGYSGKGSPDRVDALVWAITELLLTPTAAYRDPRVRAL